ncbi:MAG: helix-turn-helix transcriptional regulator [Lachnospiraceae bacterium]|nr:helix-turn-helix transcriptional regulator [Lachnospiraceae bacterium]
MGDFQNVFKKLRLSHGYTQAELADALGISRSRIGMYETGAREPDFETLEIIADFFNVDTDYLLGRTDKTTFIPDTKYYLNEETAKLAQEMFEDEDMRSLFHMKKDMPPERFKAHIEFMKNLYNQEKGNDF